MADACADPRDAVLLGALGGALMTARQGGDRRDPLAVLTEAVSALTGRVTTSQSGIVTPADRDAWLRRLRGAQRSDSTIRAYRDTIDDLLAWARRTGRGEALFEESTIVDYLDEYRSRCDPAPATYHRRFLLLRRFMQWLIRRDGLPDPFAELQAPPKPH